MQGQLKNLETQLATNKSDSKNDSNLLSGRLKTVEDSIPHLSTKNEISLLSERLKTTEDSIPPLNTRIKALEDINRNCDFPNSLITLVG